MPYLGNTPSTSFATVVKDTFNGGSTGYTLSKVATTNSVSVFVENVRQEPTTAYSVSGTTLTFTATTPSGTGNIYVLHMNPTTTTTHPAAQNLTAVDGTFTGAFTSRGIDDNADATAITIDSSEDVTLSGHLASGVNKNIDLRDADGHVSGRLRNVSGSNNALTIEADPDNSASDTFISFKVDTSEKMRIKSNGNVGIGINDPSHQLHIESSGSNTYATMKLEGQNRGGQIDMFQNTLITNQILGDQSGNLYFGSSGGFGQVAIDSQAYMSATNKAFGFRTSTFLTTMADDTIKTIVTNGCGLIIVSSYTYGRVAIYKHDYIGGTTLITGDTLYYATTNTDGKYSVESGSNSFTAQLRNRFGGNADFKVMFIGTYQ